MRMWAKSTTGAVLMAGFVAFGSGVGHADTTSGDGSVLGGNQVTAPISAPVNVSGNAGTVGGQSAAKSKGGASVENRDQGGPGNTTSGDGSVGGGNQVYAPVSAPVDVSGNALSVAGQAAASSKGGASVSNSYNGDGGMQTSGDGSILGGNQLIAPISAPVNVCGNALSIFGQAAAKCRGGASVKNTISGGETGDRQHTAAGDGMTTSGDGSILGGNQIVAPISVPVNVCGNALAVAGQAFAACKGGASVRNENLGEDLTTSGDGSILGGNQIVAPISAPVNICGNALAVAGQAAAMCKGGASVHNSEDNNDAGGSTSGDISVGGGNQVVAPVSVPVNVCGNAAAVLGQAAAMCKGGAHVPPEEPPTEEPPTEEPPTEEPPGEEPPGEEPPGQDEDGPKPITGSLPMTGYEPLPLLILAIGALLAGAATMVVSRRRGAGRS